MNDDDAVGRIKQMAIACDLFIAKCKLADVPEFLTAEQRQLLIDNGFDVPPPPDLKSIPLIPPSSVASDPRWSEVGKEMIAEALNGRKPKKPKKQKKGASK